MGSCERSSLQAVVIEGSQDQITDAVKSLVTQLDEAQQSSSRPRRRQERERGERGERGDRERDRDRDST